MGRNSWRRMRPHRGSRKQKLCDFIEGDTNYDVHEVKRPKTDVIIGGEDGGSKENNISEHGDNCEKEISLSNLVPVKSLSGIPLPAAATEPRPGVIFVFENASLVLAKINKTYQIVNPEEHSGFMKKHKLNRSDYRPDIIHEVLFRLLVSPLNMTGGVQAVYVKTIQGHLIKIEPTISFPESLKIFCAMMSQFFQKLSIKASRSNKCRKLLRMVKNPVTDHLPVGSHKIGLSSTSVKAAENMCDYFDTVGSDRPLVFVIGAMAHGKIGAEYIDDFIAVSRKPLSANQCVKRLCLELGKHRGIF